MKQLLTLCYFALSMLFVSSVNQVKAQSGKNAAIQFSSDEQIYIYGTAVDSGNRIVSVGYFTDSAYIQNTNQGFAGKDSYDVCIICTDDAGTIAWKKTFGSQYTSWAMTVTCDNAGNSYVSGYFEKSFALDGVSFNSVGAYNDFLMKLDHNGKVVWGTTYAVSYAAFEDNATTSLVCDKNDNLYYRLSFSNSAEVNSHVFNVPGNNTLLVKFDNAGNFSWGKVLNNSYGFFAAMATDLFGHVYIGGLIGNGKTTWDGADLPGIMDTISDGLFFAKIDGNTGNMQWVQRCTGLRSYSELTYINVSVNGSVYAGGFFGDTLTIGGVNYYATPHMYNGYQDGLVMNFDTSGKIRWLQHYGNFNEPEYPAGFCMDAADYVYIGGTYDAPVTLGSKTLFSTKARDIYVIRFDRGGNYIESTSSKAISTSSFANIVALTTDAHKKLFVTGSFNSQTDFGGDTLSCFGPSSSFVWEVASTFSGIEPEIQEPEDIFSLYPNPLSGNTINLQMNPGITKGSIGVSCIDETGRVVISQILQPENGASDGYSLSVPNLKSGVYFIRIVSESGISVRKFIKN